MGGNFGWSSAASAYLRVEEAGIVATNPLKKKTEKNIITKEA